MIYFCVLVHRVFCVNQLLHVTLWLSDYRLRCCWKM